MKKDIQVTGLGNALVDLQYEVSEDELSELEFEKGMMTLVDADKQKQVMAKFQNRTHNRCSGGSAANTIIAFAGFGGTAAYQTHLGADNLGDYYFKEFEELGIQLHAQQIDTDPTGTCFVMITPDSERTMVTHLGATALHAKKHINPELAKRSEWLYIEGYKFSEQDSTHAVHHSVELCKEYDTKIALTFSDRFIIDVFRERLDYAVNNADLIFCNDVEACAYTNLKSGREAFDKLCQTVENVCVTLGKDGSLVKWDGKVYEIPPYRARLADTTGAGDIYAAGFLYGIIDTGEAELAGHLASYSASLVVSQLGARLDRSHKAFKNKIYEAHKLGRLK